MANKMQECFELNMDRLIRDKKEFVLWGAGVGGSIAKRKIADYGKSSIKPSFVIDNNPALWDKEGIVSPEDFFNNFKEKIDTVFVCVYLADEVVNQLKINGYKGRIVPFIPAAMEGDRYLELYSGYEEEIEKLLLALEDRLSRDTVKTFFNVAKTGDISLWEGINGRSEHKLIEPQILQFTQRETFVDVGAFTGDTTKNFIRETKGKYKKIIGLEPDKLNFNILREYYSELNNACALDVAATDKEGYSEFWGDLSESCAIMPNAPQRVKTQRLDNIVAAEKASFIKISTNGGDLLALRGADGLINRNKPKLSYYCGGEQLFLIPRFLSKFNLGYRFYIRHYGLGLQGMIGYAI